VAVDVKRITPEHDAWQMPGGEEQWSDSFYFGGGDGRGLAFYSRVGRRPNEGITEAALGAWLPGQGFLLTFAREPAGERIGSGPVEFEPVVPLLVWTLRFDGAGRLFERAEHVATERDRYEQVTVSGSLRFTAWTDPLSFASGLTGAVATSHYEQPGSVAGVIDVAGRRHALAGSSLRDHSWGVRDWQRVPYWRWLGLVVDPDTFVVVNNVGLDGGGETAGGFMMLDGRLSGVVACEMESELDPKLGCQRSFVARARDALDRETVMEGDALEVAPLRQRRGGRLTLVNEGLTRYHWEGRTAVGISEFLFQAPDAG
jgi:hypothetical protein